MSRDLQAAEEALAAAIAGDARVPATRSGMDTARVLTLTGANWSADQSVTVAGLPFELTRGTDWSGAFQTAVDSLGPAVVGRLALLAYHDGQPMILDLIGVTRA